MAVLTQPSPLLDKTAQFSLPLISAYGLNCSPLFSDISISQSERRCGNDWPMRMLVLVIGGFQARCPMSISRDIHVGDACEWDMETVVDAVLTVR